MKAAADTKTGDLLPAHDLAGERPAAVSGSKRRGDKMREARGLKAITVNLPIELVNEFHTKRKAQNKSANDVIEHLLKTQFLRKR